MNIKGFIKEYVLIAFIALLLLIFLPPILVPYFGVFGAYAANIVTLILVIVALWVGKKAQRSV
jgi:O-antigen/teichoic acid export membrane protein